MKPLDDLRSKRENLGKNISKMGKMHLEPISDNDRCIAVLRIILKNGNVLSNEKLKFVNYMKKQIFALINYNSEKEELESICSSLIDTLIKKKVFL